MPETDLSLLICAAEAAGDIALGYFKNAPKIWDKDENAGPVTEADLAVNADLETRLKAARPDFGWLSEESVDTSERLNKDRVFIIDPIDGTRSFIQGANTWAHSIAIAEQGIITAAVVYLPARGMIYAASAGDGATLNGKPIHASDQGALGASHVLAARPTLDAQNWKSGAAPEFKRHHRPSLAYRLSLVAEGRFDAMLTLRPSWEWDIAAGALLATETGAIISDRAGKALRFNNADPRLDGVVAAGAKLHAPLLSELASA